MKARREKGKVKFQNVSATTITEVKQRLTLVVYSPLRERVAQEK
jgi:hypothetical protein